MKRLLSTMRWDIQLQLRNSFYYASAFVAVVLIIMLKQLPDINWALWWPVVIMENLVINAFYFMAGMLLLEKGEGTLEAQIVTPLRPWEYLTSKVLTLGALSLLETLVVVVAVSGFKFNWILLVLGVLLLITMYGLYGFTVVARYDSISEFILPSVVWTLVFSVPLLYYFDLWRSWVMFIHPIQAPLVLMQAAFEKLPGSQIAYGVLYPLLWVGIAFAFSQRAFYRFVVTKEGVKKNEPREYPRFAGAN